MNSQTCKYPIVQSELKKLLESDQYVRIHGDLTKVDAVMRMYKTDVMNQRKLKKILAKIKLPTVENIGKIGTEAVWLVAQHAMSDLDLMLRVLYLMQEIAEKDPKQTYYRGIPLLVDRSNIMQGKKQVYGSQIWVDPANGQPMPFPIDDIANIDERRKQFGLESFSEYIKKVVIQKPNAKKKVLEILYI